IITIDHSTLVLCTAQYMSISHKNIGIIILEHESSSGYKMIARPHFDLRIFVELFASKVGAKFILGDTLLRFETIARRELDGLVPLVPLSFRLDFAGEIKILGREEKKFKVLLNQSIQQIKSTIERKENVFIFSLRKGLATMTICRDCNEAVLCDKCHAPVVLYLSSSGKKRIYSCNRCKREIDPKLICRNCGSWNLMPLGIGTDTVSEHVRELVNLGELSQNTKVFKLDKESAKNAKGAEKIIKEFVENPGSILVGTEMAFSYINEKVPLSVIASFDSLWSIPNFKMSEKVIHIVNGIMQNTREKIIIQTKNDKDGVLLAIKNSNLLSFAREELDDRRNLGYPPYKRFIKVIYVGDKEKTLQARNMIEESLAEYSPEVFSGFMPKVIGKYSTNALIKIAPEKWSLPEISPNGVIEENLYNKLQSLPFPFQVIVDPEDLL
ncbi:MAG: hypothetical protein ABIS26_01450, partial [Candidatus Paceibacterota bacterium]